ncbi:methylmalonyl Co-A mutase-associated GTPase MeaB [Parafilimonas sp.]|uniref:methylmalonyl Co-A mutase-associated GTPase MeaB n=1 Tax=Parafilimonas sp. TaxID=1969739 RepID=UPI003F7CF872
MQWNNLLQEIQNKNVKALARAISLIENEFAGYEDFLKLLPFSTKKIIGITGPPGAGKSTIVDCLINEFAVNNNRVAVLCIDPSSPFTQGALLGDRIRMNEWYNNPNVYIRSLASRGSMHGLHPKIIEITDVLKAAPFDIIIIETVGAGQVETEIARLADTSVVVLVPEAGDEIQNMKAGLMEIADIFVINKADRPEADRFVKNLRAMLPLYLHEKKKKAPVLKTIATEKKGIKELLETIIKHQQTETEKLKSFMMQAEKVYKLIEQKRMSDIDIKKLASEIERLSADKNFSLYRFAETFGK